MTSIITAMQEALARIQSAETREDRIEAEDHMAQVIRAQYLNERISEPREPEDDERPWRLTNPAPAGAYGTYYWVCRCDSFTAIRNGRQCPRCFMAADTPRDVKQAAAGRDE